MLPRGWWVVAGMFGVAVAGKLHAAEVPSPAQPPWSIKRWVRCDDARPGVGEATGDAASSKYLHIELALPATEGRANLHQFKIVDAGGRVVAEAYGFHAKRSTVVFEGDWSRLEGLYLAGAGHREPLTASPAVGKHAQPATERGPPSKPEPPVVSSRRPSDPGPSARDQSAAPAAEERLDQEVLVTHLSRMNVQGMDFRSELQYRVLSVLHVEKRDADGSMAVVQRVEQAESLKADPLTQWVLRDLLGRLVGATFRIAVGPDGRVTAFEGATARMHAAAGNNLLGAPGIQMVSIIDPDGWREIAELTFFRPQLPSEDRRSWDRPITHSWGPLGSWSGKVVFTQIEPQDALLRFSYAFQMNHHSPKSGGNGQPFQIVRADFQHQKAGGTLLFDPAKGRVVEAREEFPVKGQLTVEMLGQEGPVRLDETQQFHIRIRDRNPAVERRRDE